VEHSGSVQACNGIALYCNIVHLQVIFLDIECTELSGYIKYEGLKSLFYLLMNTLITSSANNYLELIYGDVGCSSYRAVSMHCRFIRLPAKFATRKRIS